MKSPLQWTPLLIQGLSWIKIRLRDPNWAGEPPAPPLALLWPSSGPPPRRKDDENNEIKHVLKRKKVRKQNSFILAHLLVYLRTSFVFSFVNEKVKGTIEEGRLEGTHGRVAECVGV